MIKRIIPVAALGLAVMLLPSCRKTFDINTNPNVAQNVTPNLLLTQAELEAGTALGVDFQINGSIWAQYWTQYYNASQYKRLEQYQPDGSDYNRVWAILYAGCLKDLQKMDQIASASNLNQYRAISKLMSAYIYQVITDAWGDVPFSEALKGDEGITSPKYDPQSEIYAGLLNMVDSGMALIDPSDPNLPGGDDLIYGGDMDKWAKFGNTLKLKILLRMSEVDPAGAQAGIEALYATSPSFIDFGDDAMIQYSSTSGNQNPLYSEMVGLGSTQNLIASATSVDSMNDNNDDRVFAFYIPAGSGVVGIAQGYYDAPSGTTFSPVSELVGAHPTDPASATAPVKFMTSYESYFLQAEAAARGWDNGTGDAQALFENGIYASFEAYVTPDPDAAAAAYIAGSYWGMYPAGGTVDEQIRHIITQKWFSMNGNQGFEAWTEWRRTGYPDFLVISANSRIGNVFPARFFYPSDELTTNLNFPGQPVITDKVWWDTN